MYLDEATQTSQGNAQDIGSIYRSDGAAAYADRRAPNSCTLLAGLFSSTPEFGRDAQRLRRSVRRRRGKRVISSLDVKEMDRLVAARWGIHR